MRPFKNLSRKNGIEDFDQYFAFTVKKDGKTTKVAIDFRDKPHLNLTALAWCDVYGKVNYNAAEIGRADLTADDRKKVERVGTNFGIKLWPHPVSGYHFVMNYLRSGFSPGVNFKRFWQGYRWQMTRAGIDDYKPKEAENNYVFFISTLWKNDKDSDVTNVLRAQYIRSCRSMNLNFEGGLFTKNTSGHNGYSDIVTNQYVDHTDFAEKIKKSMVVFNTPAVWGCHGWKLGEFLAMGKAIISSTFNNEMPDGLQHGKNIHFVKDEKEMREAVQRITTDQAYREKLEKGATDYYQQHIEPAAIVSKLIQSH
jgi:hypothetical protein